MILETYCIDNPKPALSFAHKTICLPWILTTHYYSFELLSKIYNKLCVIIYCNYFFQIITQLNYNTEISAATSQSPREAKSDPRPNVKPVHEAFYKDFALCSTSSIPERKLNVGLYLNYIGDSCTLLQNDSKCLSSVF